MNETELIATLKLVMERSNGKIRTAIPGRIVAFDPEKQRATCIPAVKSFYYDIDEDQPIAYSPPPIANCPVHFPGGGGFSVRYPLAAGDDCLILCAERSIDEWMATGGASNTPRDLRRFDLSDAIVIPGLRPAARPLADFNPDSLEIVADGGSTIRVNANGTIFVGNATSDAVQQLEDALSALNSLTTALVTDMAAIAAAALSSPATPVTNGTLAGFFTTTIAQIFAIDSQAGIAKALIQTLSE